MMKRKLMVISGIVLLAVAAIIGVAMYMGVGGASQAQAAPVGSPYRGNDVFPLTMIVLERDPLIEGQPASDWLPVYTSWTGESAWIGDIAAGEQVQVKIINEDYCLVKGPAMLDDGAYNIEGWVACNRLGFPEE